MRVFSQPAIKGTSPSLYMSTSLPTYSALQTWVRSLDVSSNAATRCFHLHNPSLFIKVGLSTKDRFCIRSYRANLSTYVHRHIRPVPESTCCVKCMYFKPRSYDWLVSQMHQQLPATQDSQVNNCHTVFTTHLFGRYLPNVCLVILIAFPRLVYLAIQSTG